MSIFARDSLNWICRHLVSTSPVEVPVHELLKAYTDIFCEVRGMLVLLKGSAVSMDGLFYGSTILQKGYAENAFMNLGTNAPFSAKRPNI